jgi:lysophospholipase L1-like esterase
LYVVLLACASVLGASRGAEPFELRDGDRVVLIGNTLIEREQRYGYWEAALTSRWPERNVTFRNLGWSGDTVWGESRAGFDTPAQGFRRLIDRTLEQRPTVLFVGYGLNESFAGPGGLPRFKDGLKRSLDALAPAKARIIILSPLHVEAHGSQLTDPSAINANLAQYRDELRAAATAGGHRFVDLFQLSALPGHWPRPLTDDGMHLTEFGYNVSAHWLEQGLGLSAVPAWPPDRAERLRQAIIAKNQQFFHRWRPQNETYLFGFRKHEQGKNAAEIPLFDPVVARLEKEIARLRKPESHVDQPKRVTK